MDIETFIRRWRDREGGAERANATMYLLELTQALDLPPPDPAGADTAHNDYVFERAVRSPFCDAGPPNRIDLYKRGCFVLEAKQSRWAPRQDGAWRAPPDGRWDAMMRRARAQAHGYVALLPADHPAPPFLIVCDVARQFEIWADFSGTGRGYTPFPDRTGFRIAHEALIEAEVQNRLRAIWTAPQRLAPILSLHQIGSDGGLYPVRPRPFAAASSLRALPPGPRLRFTPVDPPGPDALPQHSGDQPLAVQAALVRAGAPLATHDLARRFHGRRREARIERALTSLHRYGHVSRLPDGRWIAAQSLSQSP
ncbi:MAG: type IIL restriction-modification enzyme MmeI [Brevundimonas sp.]|uniref:type IIL restriction-modification enzyme MmeI n=1 Tax=Brevundimonas sp. TaxID=1871086 RepID=UPI004034DF65